MKCLHIIGDLDVGGAEMMLYKLVARPGIQRFTHEVVSLIAPGPVGRMLKDAKIPVSTVGMTRGRIGPMTVIKLARLIRTRKPDIIQTWMYNSDLAGGIAAAIANVAPVIWGIRHGNPADNKPATRVIARLCAMLSGVLPDKIVSCSMAGRDNHIRIGYKADNIVVIPNGFDLTGWQFDASSQASLLRELGLPESSVLVGMAGRYVPAKDHQNFVRAAGIVKDRIPRAEFVLCGTGISWSNRPLSSLIETAGLERCFHLLENRSDMPRIFSALDTLVSSSGSEAFSNTIGEAMACETPCVVTDTGESAHIVGNTGIVIAPRDHVALAGGIADMLGKSRSERKALGRCARRRVLEKFHLPDIVRMYEQLYLEVKR